jgi:hypothetical protein
MRGGARPGAGRAKSNDPKLKKIFDRATGLAKLDKIGKKEEQRITSLLQPLNYLYAYLLSDLVQILT